jgi:hypothetical protein
VLSDHALGERPVDRGRGVDRLIAIAGAGWMLPVYGVLIALASWEPLPLGVASGLDPSAVNGVNLAANLGFDQGTSFVWTYGPLGFLEEPSVAGEWTAALGVIYTALVRVALATSLLWAARRSFGLLGGALLAYAVCAVTGAEAVPISIAIIWCVVALDPERPDWVRPLLTFGGGAFAALEILVKLNIGVEAAALLAIAVVAMPGPRLRNVAEFAGTFLIAFVLLWLLTGQAPADLDDYLRNSYEIVSGYSAAMGTEAGAVEWDWIAALVMIAFALGAATWTTRGFPATARWWTLVLLAALCLATVKQGFVRHDVGHILTLVAILAAPLLALHWRGTERFAAGAAVVAFSLLAAPLTGRAEGDVYRPLAAADDAIDQLRTGLDAGRREAAAEAQRAAARGAYAIDPQTLALLRSGTVAVDPWEASAAWAYDLDWRPLPVFQEYAAYTPRLDELNAAALISDDGPNLVLRHLTNSGRATDSIDGRYAPFDVPATTRTMSCNFRAVRTTDRFQVLERAPNRCGPDVELGEVEGRYNQPIEVPRVGPEELLFARIEGVEPRGLGALRTAVYKDVRRVIAVDDRVYRLVGPTAANGLLLSAPPRLDFPAPFAVAPNPTTITFGRDDGFASGPDSFEVEFFKVRVNR